MGGEGAGGRTGIPGCVSGMDIVPTILTCCAPLKPGPFGIGWSSLDGAPRNWFGIATAAAAVVVEVKCLGFKIARQSRRTVNPGELVVLVVVILDAGAGPDSRALGTREKLME